MSTLSNLKLITSKRQASGGAVAHRRGKLAEKIDEQIALITAQQEGRVYAPKKTKIIVNKATGQRGSIEVIKRVKEWFWYGEGGKIHLNIRYGSKIIELAKGKNAIEVADTKELLDTLALIRTAVMAGELDSQIEATSEKLRAVFTR